VIEQRWLLIFSEQAYKREKKTLEKKVEKEKEKLEKALWHFEKQIFHCPKDANKAFDEIKRGYKLHSLKGEVILIEKYAKKGKPKESSEKVLVGYKMKTSFEANNIEIEKILNRKGRFILATNELNIEEYQDEQILEEYKEQQDVERGFRFLKDPWFMVDSIFLKTPKRIEALMMIMTLCLMVYNVGQYRVRESLKTEGTTLPNQLGKQVQNPTMRWIFQLMEGVGIVLFYREGDKDLSREVITNLTEVRKRIIRLFGSTAVQLYGLIQKNTIGGLGM